MCKKNREHTDLKNQQVIYKSANKSLEKAICKQVVKNM